MKTFHTLLLLLLFVSGQVFAADHKATVTSFVKAFNDKDIEAMLSLAAPDMKYMFVAGQKIATETADHEALRKAMLSYFKSSPTTRSEIRKLSQSGNFISATEEAFWTVAGVAKSQCSLAVYEFKDEKIQHVWYFPSHKC